MANKLTFEQVESEFKKVYPTGTIFINPNKKIYDVEVSFKAESKCYNYKVKNHVELINKLKLNINAIYEKDYNMYVRLLEEAKERLSLGYTEIDNSFFEEGGQIERIPFTRTDRLVLEMEIKILESKIKDVWIV